MEQKEKIFKALDRLCDVNESEINDIGKEAESIIIEWLIRRNTYFRAEFSDSFDHMVQNIKNDFPLLNGVMVRFEDYSQLESENKGLAEDLKIAEAKNDEWHTDYNGMRETLEERLAEMQSSKLSIEEEWERAVARAEQVEIKVDFYMKEVIRRKMESGEALNDAERSLVINALR